MIPLSVAVATIRLEESLLKEARRHGINVSQAARDGIEEAIRRQRMLEAVDYLAKIAVQPKEPSLTTLRRLRDGAS